MLILAVEPDRRQAKQLTALMRRHVGAELLLADSGSQAVAALAGRIPDLILTPPLLPPKDEAVLTGWLRELGDAASHVQTLAIPILASVEPRGRETTTSIFGRLREQPASPPAEGCEPDVFAEQVRVYLDRAAGERRPQVRLSDDLDDTITFDDLVLEEPSSRAEPRPPASIPEPAPADPPRPVPVPNPAAVSRMDPGTLRDWETELGLDAAPRTAPPLWRVTQTAPAEAQAALTPPPVRVAPANSTFDPAHPRFAPLFRRLETLAAAARDF